MLEKPESILFLVSSMRAGGAERVASLLCNYWARNGRRVTLAPTFSGRGECDYAIDPAIDLVYLADRLPASRVPQPKKIRRLRALRELIRETRPDVIISFLTNVNIAAIIATLDLNIPVFVSERTYPPAMPTPYMLALLRRWLYPKAGAVVMQTDRGLEWLADTIPRSLGAVVPNPVQYPLPVTEPIISVDITVAPARKVILAVGRLGPEKGFADLIKVFSSLHDQFPLWDLVIIGEGSERTLLEDTASLNGVTNRVFLPGVAGNMADWYQRASIFALSSHFEGFPNALLEAMAYGLPAVSRDCDTGPSSIIRDNIDGLLVPPDKFFSGFKEALRKLMESSLLRKRMSASAAEVRQRFALHEVARQWDALYLGGKT